MVHVHPNAVTRRRNTLQACCAAACLIACVLAADLTGVPAAAAQLPAEQASAVDAAIEEAMHTQHIPGLSAAVVVDGQLVYERGFGLADVENDVAATSDTVYRLASISKMITAAAALQLVEQGKLQLDAPVQRYVPGFPEKAEGTITPALLLKHQSGIRHYRDNEVLSVTFYNRVGDALAIFQDDPLLFAPGEKMSYTTYGYNLLGAAIEGASGQDYVRYVERHVFDPAGMKSTRPDNPFHIIPHRAAGYRLKGKGAAAILTNDNMVDVTNKIPGGGWCGTAGDLARFAIALVGGQLLEPATLETMWTPQPLAGGDVTASGLGCFIDQTESGQRRVNHSGGQPKVSTFLIFAPETRSAVALMCNLRGASLKPLANTLLDQVGQPAAAAGSH